MREDEEQPHTRPRRPLAGPGINPLEPRDIDRRYTYDLMFDRWYLSDDENEMVRRGRGLIVLLLSWILASDKFEDEERERAKDIKAGTDIKFKVQEKISEIGTPDEHYQMKYDHYVKNVRGREYEVATKSMQWEWTNVVLNAQETAIAQLSAMCLEKSIISMDYRVGGTPEQKMDEGVGKY